MQNARVWSRSLQELYSNCLSGDSLMEVPRERRRCSFEVHLVYCWPFWFNLYHQRALLNYWQLNLFSLGYRHWVNTLLLRFLFFHSILSLSLLFIYFILLLLLLLLLFCSCFSSAHPDGAPRWSSMRWQMISGPPKKPSKAPGWRATNQMEWFCSSFKHRLPSIHLVGPRSWSRFSTKTSQTL